MIATKLAVYKTRLFDGNSTEDVILAYIALLIGFCFINGDLTEANANVVLFYGSVFKHYIYIERYVITNQVRR